MQLTGTVSRTGLARLAVSTRVRRPHRFASRCAYVVIPTRHAGRFDSSHGTPYCTTLVDFPSCGGRTTSRIDSLPTAAGDRTGRLTPKPGHGSPFGHCYGRTFRRPRRSARRRRGHVTVAELEDWMAQLHVAQDAGDFLFAETAFLVSAARLR